MLTMAHVIAPVLHAESRVDEAEADDFALKITHDAANYRSVMEKLRRMNLEEACAGPALRLLFGTHPTYRQRLDWADACAPSDRRHAANGEGGTAQSAERRARCGPCDRSDRSDRSDWTFHALRFALHTHLTMP